MDKYGMEEYEPVINLDVMLARQKMSLSELAEILGVQLNNLSIFKNGKSRVVKIKTLMNLCTVLQCTPNDIIEFRKKGRGVADLRERR